MRKTSKKKPVLRDETLPCGGVTLRKYAAIVVALGHARSGLYSALDGDLADVKRALDLTSLDSIAKALRCSEGDLAIIWDDHLSHDELERIKLGPPPEELPPMTFDDYKLVVARVQPNGWIAYIPAIHGCEAHMPTPGEAVAELQKVYRKKVIEAP